MIPGSNTSREFVESTRKSSTIPRLVMPRHNQSMRRGGAGVEHIIRWNKITSTPAGGIWEEALLTGREVLWVVDLLRKFTLRSHHDPFDDPSVSDRSLRRGGVRIVPKQDISLLEAKQKGNQRRMRRDCRNKYCQFYYIKYEPSWRRTKCIRVFDSIKNNVERNIPPWTRTRWSLGRKMADMRTNILLKRYEIFSSTDFDERKQTKARRWVCFWNMKIIFSPPELCYLPMPFELTDHFPYCCHSIEERMHSVFFLFSISFHQPTHPHNR